jgi:LysR family transcriptional regulator of beta-lactamase
MPIISRPFSLNALRVFETSARHLSFTRAADELCVTQAAVSHQIKALENQLGVHLFRRTTRGLILTDEGAALSPIVADALTRLTRGLGAVAATGPREVLTLGVVGTFAVGYLMPRLPSFRSRYPDIDLRLLINNNKVDLWTETLDFAIRFGDGSWHGVRAERLLAAPFSPLCAQSLAEALQKPADLGRQRLLRSYRSRDWPEWLAAAGVEDVAATGASFDSSIVMVQAAMCGEGVALAPPSMFHRELGAGLLVQPFPLAVGAGAYWLTRLMSKEPTPAMQAFESWLVEACTDASPQAEPGA